MSTNSHHRSEFPPKVLVLGLRFWSVLCLFLLSVNASRIFFVKSDFSYINAIENERTDFRFLNSVTELGLDNLPNIECAI
jgi:hypothetical protein